MLLKVLTFYQPVWASLHNYFNDFNEIIFRSVYTLREKCVVNVMWLTKTFLSFN